jgi:hypothetical protein
MGRLRMLIKGLLMTFTAIELILYVHVDEIQLVDPDGSIHVVKFIKFSQFDENDTIEVLGFDVPPLSHGLKF